MDNHFSCAYWVNGKIQRGFCRSAVRFIKMFYSYFEHFNSQFSRRPQTEGNSNFLKGLLSLIF